MQRTNISNLKNNLSRYLEKVRQGEVIEIVDRDLPIARISRIEPSRQSSDEWIRSLARLELVKPGRMQESRLILEEPAPAGSASKVLDALIQEREERR